MPASTELSEPAIMHFLLNDSPAPVAPIPRHATAVGTPPRPAGKARLMLAGPWLLAAALSMALPNAQAAETVTVDNFVRAETDTTFKRFATTGGFGQFTHVRQPTPIDKQSVIRMNRDTLYSAAVIDLASSPATIVKPAAGGRFQSLLVINQDHSVVMVEHGAGEFVLTRDKVGTRYAIALVRTFVDAANAEDVKAANAQQDRIVIRQADKGRFEVPDWDEASLKKLRDAINVLAATKTDASGMFGDKGKLNPIDHLLGTASGWGGNPKSAAMYVNVVPEKNDGKTPYTLTVREVPVDGFWSVTVYNEKGFMEKNALDAYSFNNVGARKSADGSITIRFGGDPAQPNYLPIGPGWNYTVRLYQPRSALLDGSWKFPAPQVAR
jgi:hypothetical protein